MFKKFLKHYDTAKFINDDGSLNLTDNVKVITDECLRNGLVQNNTLQTIEGFTLYPNEFFCPINMSSGYYDRTENTATIHWFIGSWLPDELKKQKSEDIDYYSARNQRYLKKKRNNRIAKVLRKVFGDKLYTKIRNK